MSTTHRDATAEALPCREAATNGTPRTSDLRVAVLPQTHTAPAGSDHAANEAAARRHIEKAIHHTFELPTEFSLGELAAIVGFVICRGARLRLARNDFSVEHDDDFTWVRSTHVKNAETSRSPLGVPNDVEPH